MLLNNCFLGWKYSKDCFLKYLSALLNIISHVHLKKYTIKIFSNSSGGVAENVSENENGLSSSQEIIISEISK